MSRREDEIMKSAVKLVIGIRRQERIVDMENLVQKCKKCFHYFFRDPEGVRWDDMLTVVGHVCDYSSMCDPIRELIVWGEVRDVMQATLDGSLNDFNHVYESQNGERTIARRIELGECEFKEFPEPRTKRWGEKDESWDMKHKDEFAKLLGPNLITRGFKESDVPEIIEQEFGEA